MPRYMLLNNAVEETTPSTTRLTYKRKENRNMQNNTHISSETRVSKSQHQVTQEKTTSAVITKQHYLITPSTTIKTFNILLFCIYVYTLALTLAITMYDLP
jgi:hypothetical protein